MFWFYYIIFSILFSYFLSKLSGNYNLNIFVISLCIFTSPTQIEVSESNLTPAFFTFIFNVLFEEEFSLRVLRPLVITIPICLVFTFASLIVKKKFF